MIIKGHIERSRKKASPLGTPGRMILSNGFSCDTLELPPHDNERGRSCTLPMPGGMPVTYRGAVWYSPMLKRPVIRYEDQNGRHDCLVHNGNWAADETDIDGDGTPEVTQVHGCTEVGSGYGDVQRKDGKMQWGIRLSGKTLDAMIASLRDPSVPEPQVQPSGFISGYHEVEITYSWETE